MELGMAEPAEDDASEAIDEVDPPKKYKCGTKELDNVKYVKLENHNMKPGVQCLRCGQQIQFHSVFYHFTKSKIHRRQLLLYELSIGMVQTWLCHKDGKRKRNKKHILK